MKKPKAEGSSSSDIEQGIIGLLQSVKAAHEQEITDRLRVDIERDNRFQEAASYPVILAEDTIRLAERMMYLAKHRRVARRLGKQMIEPMYRSSEIKVLHGPQKDANQRASIQRQAVHYWNNRRKQNGTILITPLLFVSEPEYVYDNEKPTEGALIRHGWCFTMHAFGGQTPAQHTPHSMTIASRFVDTVTGKSTNNNAYHIALEEHQGLTIANLYANPGSGLMPAKWFEELPAEEYLLPLGLIRGALSELGVKPLG
ncbi:MAG TPA: hypothetical protein VFI84_01115 [Candidatus Saccharimonadales bacterium]|nr:hypothetical protein [Candidatus Saccharimonadales bacterium]